MFFFTVFCYFFCLQRLRICLHSAHICANLASSKVANLTHVMVVVVAAVVVVVEVVAEFGDHYEVRNDSNICPRPRSLKLSVDKPFLSSQRQNFHQDVMSPNFSIFS